MAGRDLAGPILTHGSPVSTVKIGLANSEILLYRLILLLNRISSMLLHVTSTAGPLSRPGTQVLSIARRVPVHVGLILRRAVGRQTGPQGATILAEGWRIGLGTLRKPVRGFRSLPGRRQTQVCCGASDACPPPVKRNVRQIGE
jgi:hypothetical protein